MVNLVKDSQRKLDKSEELLISKHLALEQCAWQSGFYKRAPKKITATFLFFSFWQMQQLGKNSLRKWSRELSRHTIEVVSK